MTGSSVPRKRRHSEVDDTEATQTGSSGGFSADPFGGRFDDDVLERFLGNIDLLVPPQDAVSDIIYSFQIW